MAGCSFSIERQMVIIEDRVYGKVEVNEEFLLELMASEPLQRLKKIDQHGARQYIEEFGRVSRYEHCVGVMILLRKLGASLEEQIAGLLHDVPHTAFSHVIDWVFSENNHEQDFHEKFFEKIVLNSEIPAVLEKYGFDVNRVINESLFGLLERSSPNLCGDRLDYSFRDYIAFMGKDDGRVKRFLKHLIVHNQEIMFNNEDVALEYATHYLWMDKEKWADYRSVASYHYLAKALKLGVDEKVISFDDLFLTDAEVMQKLKYSKNEVILKNLSYLNPNLKVELVNKEQADINSFAKVRFVDPKILDKDGSLKRVSEYYPELLDKIKIHKERIVDGIYLKVFVE